MTDTVAPAPARARRVEATAATLEALVARQALLGGAPTPFQSWRWLSAWLRHVGAPGNGQTPFLVLVEDDASGRPLMALPFSLSRHHGLRVITFCDAGMTDYNLPVLLDPARWDSERAADAWRAVRRALPPADIVHLDKMPADPSLNPLALLPGSVTHRLEGNVIRIEDTFEAWLKGLDRPVRKELGRCLRVFERHPGARFERVTDPARAAHVFTELQRLQSERSRHLGWSYILDRPENAALYAELVRDGIADNSVVLTALTCGDEVVAALLGVADGRTCAMTRLTASAGEWANCSPGRLILERTMRHLHAEGFRVFDFTIGSYAYKRRLGARPRPLLERLEPLSARGHIEVAGRRARRWLAGQGWLRDIRDRVRDLRGSPKGTRPPGAGSEQD
jgi:CelD/BcsL family acetyltransferase involved in cellulose biosynthesis